MSPEFSKFQFYAEARLYKNGRICFFEFDELFMELGGCGIMEEKIDDHVYKQNGNNFFCFVKSEKLKKYRQLVFKFLEEEK